MKNYLHKLLLDVLNTRANAIATQKLLHFTFNVITIYKQEKSRVRFLSGQFFFIAVLFLISIVKSNAQITKSSTFPLNDYLYTISSNPYPLVNNNKLSTIDISKFVNVMNYGAKGDGKTFDDAAIVNAFKAAQYGIIFPAGKTFLLSKISKITLTHDITVWAYGATIKMGDFTRYSALSLQSGLSAGSYRYSAIWLGGTLDGNRQKQNYPTGPNAQTWEETHGRFLGFEKLEFAFVKDVNLVNLVMDGIGIDACKLGIIADSKAINGAEFKFSDVQEQGTYFKVTRAGYKTCYFINLRCEGGSIGIHASYQTKLEMDKETQVVIRNCYITGGVQNPIHIEDAYKCFMYKDTIQQPIGPEYIKSNTFSNRTGLLSIKNCYFENTRVNLNESGTIKNEGLAIIDSNTFVNNNPDITMMIEGFPTVISHNTFTGKCRQQQSTGKNHLANKYIDFGSLSIYGGYAIDSCTFQNGSKPASLLSGGFVTPACKQISVTQPNKQTQPSNNDWKKIFSSYIDIYSDTKQYLGRITCSQVSQALNIVSSNSSQITNAVINNKNDLLKGGVINVYPNPVTDVLHLKLNEKISGKTILSIYDEQGQLVQTETIYKNALVLLKTINVKTFSAGFYILQIVNGHKKTSQQFIITK
jgi:hypothetical protein